MNIQEGIKHPFLGKRIRRIRKEVFAQSQVEFAEMLNDYLKSRDIVDKRNMFTQNTITKMETENSLTAGKLITLLNFLYEKKQINPSWLLLEFNKSQPPYLNKLSDGKNSSEIQAEIKSYQMKIDQGIDKILNLYGLIL
ncbi:hypothetical protein [Poritiphilus flavus]|uniref:Uncharacterized protein n=1 Tax=Poritiphilus flavus TaxID=2697053 RepID=A0A6L9E9V1_9FLAO|nr:hypothetical protein [Poritiphilus flavus]NAS11490.1 hypothetical protein [Poritiphilus flavus]